MQTITALMVLATATQSISHERDFRSREWTDLIRGGLVPYHQLTLNDFRIAERGRGDSEAFTVGFIRYRFEPSVTGTSKVTANVAKLRVWSGLDRNSTWRRPWLDARHPFLAHEQHHLDINELAAHRFANIPASQLPTGSGENRDQALRDLANKIDQYFQTVLREAQRQHDLYDRETRGGTDETAQRRWSNATTNALRASGIRPLWTPDR